MKSGFLKKKSKKKNLGLLCDERSNRNLIGAGVSSGGWENYKYSPDGMDDEQKTDIPIYDGPILPQSIMAPKNSLSVWYSRRYKDFVFRANDCFVSWHCGPDHERYFTCVFTCPSSGEKFTCGTFGNEAIKKTTEEKVKDGDDIVTVIWYRKKKDAENAAAARALDCFSYREGEGDMKKSYGLCTEPPYLEDASICGIPISAPDQVYDEVMTQPVNRKIKEDHEMDEDTELFRKDYRSLRGNK
mmetsp:Transcript_6262/g.11840  ORF Transcript_6262/g.11840 Transcript_6262/m.11840 type:complete len:243 (+) Transcript_6262:94-822(+)